ncbi:MAG: hypothetical protein EKK40_13795 [Bradyrhizobiaceae bacterium]|nr:MAG: hypothetical protein EKK40_13795 [Bradyrhizobiaceae bacterium]
MQKSMIRLLGVTAAFAITGLLAACNDSPCSDSAVLSKVKELFDKQQFGQFIEAPPSVFVVQTKSATEVSTDKDSTKNRCSVLITTDIIEMMRFTKQASEEEIAKIRVEAPKKGFALTTDTLVNYVVQPLANGQNYVTVLP